MAKIRLTKTVLERAKKNTEYCDTEVTGLRYRVGKNGGYFSYYYKVDGKGHRIKLGQYPYMSIEDARNKVYELKSQLAKADEYTQGGGDDPTNLTVEQGLQMYIDKHMIPKKKISWKANKTAYDKLPNKFKKMKLEDVKNFMITYHINTVISESGNTTANRVYSYLSAGFRWLISQQYTENPIMYGMKKPFSENINERYLEIDELKKVLEVVETLEYPWKQAYQLIIHTGKRCGEIYKMEWDEIDYEKKTLNVPAEKTKGKKGRDDVLSDRAIEIIRSCEIEVPPGCKFVFTTTAGEVAIDKISTKVIKKVKEEVGIPNWRLHDFRATISTHLADEMDIDQNVIERILGHKKKGLVNVYNKAKFKTQVREALNKYSEWLDNLMD